MTKNKKARLNALARLLYKMQGYNVEHGYDFEKARHPQEKAMFAFAKVSLDFFEMSQDNSDIQEAMDLLSVAGPNPLLITEKDYFDRLHLLRESTGIDADEDEDEEDEDNYFEDED